MTDNNGKPNTNNKPKTHGGAGSWQSGGNWQGGANKVAKNVTTWKQCHTGKVPIVSAKAGGTLYAGGTMNGFSPDIDREALIDLAGSYPILPDAFGGANWQLGTFSVPENYLRLHVRDGHAPQWDAESAEALATRILWFINRGTDVVIYCQGGHGRTGTVVSAMLPLLVANAQTVLMPNPVSWLRKVYCKEVVESKEQLDWIKKIVAGYDRGFEFDWSEVEISKAPIVYYGGYGPKVDFLCSACNKPTNENILGAAKAGAGHQFAHYCPTCAAKPEYLVCALCHTTKGNVTVARDPAGNGTSKIIICEKCLVEEEANAKGQDTWFGNIYRV